MKRRHLSFLKSVATWGGVFVTLCGISYNFLRGGDILGAYIALVGVGLTAIGHIISGAIARHDKLDRAAGQEAIESLQFRLEEAEQALKAPHIKKLKSEYDEAHQDDWR